MKRHCTVQNPHSWKDGSVVFSVMYGAPSQSLAQFIIYNGVKLFLRKPFLILQKLLDQKICFANWTWIFSTFVVILSLDYEECVFLTFRWWIQLRFLKKAELSKYHNIGRISACSNVNMIPQRFHAENFAIESNSFWNSSYFEWKG